MGVTTSTEQAKTSESRDALYGETFVAAPQLRRESVLDLCKAICEHASDTLTGWYRQRVLEQNQRAILSVQTTNADRIADIANRFDRYAGDYAASEHSFAVNPLVDASRSVIKASFIVPEQRLKEMLKSPKDAVVELTARMTRTTQLLEAMGSELGLKGLVKQDKSFLMELGVQQANLCSAGVRPKIEAAYNTERTNIFRSAEERLRAMIETAPEGSELSSEASAETIKALFLDAQQQLQKVQTQCREATSVLIAAREISSEIHKVAEQAKINDTGSVEVQIVDSQQAVMLPSAASELVRQFWKEQVAAAEEALGQCRALCEKAPLEADGYQELKRHDSTLRQAVQAMNVLTEAVCKALHPVSLVREQSAAGSQITDPLRFAETADNNTRAAAEKLFSELGIEVETDVIKALASSADVKEKVVLLKDSEWKTDLTWALREAFGRSPAQAGEFVQICDNAVLILKTFTDSYEGSPAINSVPEIVSEMTAIRNSAAKRFYELCADGDLSSADFAMKLVDCLPSKQLIDKAERHSASVALASGATRVQMLALCLQDLHNS